MKNLAIFVSGSGTNCENIIRYFAGSEVANVALVISNKADAYAIVRAKNLNVPVEIVTKSAFEDSVSVLSLLDSYRIDFIVLAGFLLKVPDYLVDRFDGRMLNLHPALLPKYGGKGMYGHHVHEAVKAAGEKESGITIHFVSSEIDGGRIVAQFKTSLQASDTPDDIAEKIHILEMDNFPRVIDEVLRNL